MKKIIIVLLLIISVGCNKQEIIENEENNQQVEDNSNENQEIITDEEVKEEPINVYLFWGDGCPVCANLKEYFNNLDSSYNKYFNLVQYEIWYNEENRDLMHKVGDSLNQTYYALPFLVIGDEIMVGFSEAKKEYILDRIIEEYNNERYDVMKNFKV